MLSAEMHYLTRIKTDTQLDEKVIKKDTQFNF